MFARPASPVGGRGWVDFFTLAPLLLGDGGLETLSLLCQLGSNRPTCQIPPPALQVGYACLEWRDKPTFSIGSSLSSIRLRPGGVLVGVVVYHHYPHGSAPLRSSGGAAPYGLGSSSLQSGILQMPILGSGTVPSSVGSLGPGRLLSRGLILGPRAPSPPGPPGSSCRTDRLALIS